MSNALAALEARAIEFARRGDFGADARSVNEELTRIAPTNEGAWTRLARCCMELGLLDDATAALDAALQLNPQNTIARNLHVEVSRRRSGVLDEMAPRRTAVRAPRAPRSTGSRPSTARSGRSATLTLAGFGRAEFAALGHLAPQAAAESLTNRVEPLLMALNERPFAARVTDARNRAGHAGARMFRRGSLQPGTQGHVYVHQNGGRWEPQMNLGFFARTPWGRDAVAAGIAFHLAPEGEDDRAGAGRERLLHFFEVFQQLVASTWRVHLADWLRTNAGFVQIGYEPPALDLLPNEAVSALVRIDAPASLGWVFVGRWLFAERGEDVGTMTDATRFVRWIEGAFTDLLPLWGDVYRGAYRR